MVTKAIKKEMENNNNRTTAHCSAAPRFKNTELDLTLCVSVFNAPLICLYEVKCTVTVYM